MDMVKNYILTCDEHQYGSGGDVARAPFPAADHPRPEGNEQREECHHEHSHRGSGHVQSVSRDERKLI